MLKNVEELEARLRVIEERFSELGYSVKGIVQSEVKKKWKIQPQAETLFGLYTSLTIETIDPWKGNRVRFFSPILHDPETPIKSLPFAHPISSMGGIDDSGLNWPPPAGSTLCVIFETGSRQSPYYIGTTWQRDRGPDGKHNWGYNIDEYYKIHEGHRKGYLVGPDDGSQSFPPWNNESYNGFDIDSIDDFEQDADAQRKITYPNIYGFKTPQKHMLKMVDGNYKCNHKWKRIEILSSCGGSMIFKDDHIHNSGQWAHPSCGGSGSDVSDCTDEDGNPKEMLDCDGETSNSSIQGGHPSTPKDTKYGPNSNTGTNPYFKHKNECRPYKGPGTPQNNKMSLPQTGWQVLSIAGHTMGMDDSVEEPRGIPEWERSTESFDFGCNDKFLGKMFLISATGHKLIFSDIEEETGLRGENNYIRLQSAAGNKIELNDHTVGSEGCAGCPPNKSGEKRGILLQSTSNGIIQMCDEENEQCAPCRKEGGIPRAKAKKAFIKIRTGYGLEILMKDEASQESTDNQFIQVFCPQKDNKERGPHIVRLQEKASGPGQIFVRAGGDYICSTYDSHFTIVGDKEKNPSNKLTMVSKNTIIQTEEFYINTADVHALIADQVILLMAGKDCTPIEPGPCVPCVFPVLCLTPKGIAISDRVFASASPQADCASIFQLQPFCSCAPFDNCSDA